jgi:penicillin-binding protein 1B
MSGSKKKKSRLQKFAKKRIEVRRSVKIFLSIFLVMAIMVGVYLGSLLAEITQHFEGRRWDIPSRIYSDAFPLFPGLNIEKTGLMERLKRLSYVSATQSISNS